MSKIPGYPQYKKELEETKHLIPVLQDIVLQYSSGASKWHGEWKATGKSKAPLEELENYTLDFLIENDLQVFSEVTRNFPQIINSHFVALTFETGQGDKLYHLTLERLVGNYGFKNDHYKNVEVALAAMDEKNSPDLDRYIIMENIMYSRYKTNLYRQLLEKAYNDPIDPGRKVDYIASMIPTNIGLERHILIFLYDTGLEEAAKNGDLHLVKYFGNLGAVNYLGAIIEAMKNDHDNIVEYIKENKKIKDNKNYLEAAIMYNHKYIKMFLDDVSECRPALREAVESGDIKSLEILLSHPRYRIPIDCTIIEAIKNKKNLIVEYLWINYHGRIISVDNIRKAAQQYDNEEALRILT